MKKPRTYQGINPDDTFEPVAAISTKENHWRVFRRDAEDATSFKIVAIGKANYKANYFISFMKPEMVVKRRDDLLNLVEHRDDLAKAFFDLVGFKDQYKSAKIKPVTVKPSTPIAREVD